MPENGLNLKIVRKVKNAQKISEMVELGQKVDRQRDKIWSKMFKDGQQWSKIVKTAFNGRKL